MNCGTNSHDHANGDAMNLAPSESTARDGTKAASAAWFVQPAAPLWRI